MYKVKKDLCFAAVGGKSPILRYSVRYLRLSYYLINAVIFVAIFAIFGYIKYQQWKYQYNLKNTEPRPVKIIKIPYINLLQPPSIVSPDFSSPAVAPGTRPSVSVIGTPKPVPDAKAVETTIPTQDVISGPSVNTGPGTTDQPFVVDNPISDMNIWIPREVEPAYKYKPRLEYPEAARIFDYQGKAYIKAYIGTDGSVLKVAVVQTSGYPILDSAAVSYMAKCQFTPAMQQGKPVSVWIGQTITFKLQGE